ncbi:hypothetical protein N865_21515 [Intrasporangium oryzae NRRL B-24470]|uniref:Uncharacterized protein n=1 Tax=Intrasporangium oryzae NRRL B-24470 TaxID=1386089 RepID=W9G322_9MICO|nr:hypothetical protein N865_21515 [Intrasporangium oryzae NRRL B-24470]
MNDGLGNNGTGGRVGGTNGGANGGADKPEGWYYVGDGKLRYRDDRGWTSHYMSTKDPAAAKWPPPPPRTFLQQVLDDQAAVAAEAASPSGSRLTSIFRRKKR